MMDWPSNLTAPSSSGPRSTHVPASAFSHLMFQICLAGSYVRRFIPSTISSQEEPVILYSSAIAVEDEATEPHCFERLPFSMPYSRFCLAPPSANEKGKSRERRRRIGAGLA